VHEDIHKVEVVAAVVVTMLSAELHKFRLCLANFDVLYIFIVYYILL